MKKVKFCFVSSSALKCIYNSHDFFTSDPASTQLYPIFLEHGFLRVYPIFLEHGFL